MLSFFRRRRKLILISLVVIGLIFSTILISLPSVIGSNWFKEMLAGKLSETLGRTIHLNGDLSFEWSLSPRISFSELVIDSPDLIGERPMVAIEKFSINGPLFKNIWSGYQINEITAEGVQLLIEQNSNGESNWDFSNDSPPQDKQSTTPVQFPIIKKIALKDIDLVFNSAGDLRKFHFKEILAENIENNTNGSLASSFTIDGIPIVLKGGANSIQSLLTTGNLAIELDLQQGQHKLVASGIFDPDGRLSFEVMASGNDLSSLSPLFRAKLPEWRDYHLKSEVVAVFGLEPSLSLDKLKIKIGERELSGNGKVDFLGNGSLNAELELVSGSHILKTKGTYKQNGQMEFRLSASGNSLSELTPIALMDLPNWRDYSIDSQITSSGKSISLESLELRVGNQDLAGRLNIDFSPLKVSGKLKSSLLDLPELILQINKSQSSQDGSDSDPKIPFEILDDLEGDLEIAVGTFNPVRGESFTNVELVATLNNSRFAIPRISAEAFGGSISGTFKAANRKLDLKLEGSKVKAQKITALFGASSIADGAFDVSIDLQGRGASRNEIINTLAGKVLISSENAKLKAPGLKMASSGLFKILSPIIGGSTEEDSECVLVNYILKDGIASSTEQVVKLGNVYIFGEGALNFPDNNLTYNFNVNSTNPAFASLIPPFRAYGRLNNPRFVPSVSGSIASVVDTAEGATRSAFGVLTNAGKILVGMRDEELSGLALCQRAYALEQKMLSSQVGKAFDRKADLPDLDREPATVNP